MSALLVAVRNSTDGSRWILRILSTRKHGKKAPNPTNGSWWIVQILSTKESRKKRRIPPTAEVVKNRYRFYPVRGGMFIDRRRRSLRRRSEERKGTCELKV